MRVVIITESYRPDVNGVANSVARVADHLVRRGHEPMVVAPQPAAPAPSEPDPYPVLRVPSLPMPGYPAVRLALPTRRIARAIRDFRADVVHLASPFVIGAWGGAAAQRAGVPVVAVYQTDVAGYASLYRLRPATAAAWRWIRRIHGRAALTLAPSRAAADDLARNGVPRISSWGRGVDLTQFDPGHRDEGLRRELAPGGETLVGYVGRLAPEKRVDLLHRTAALPGVRVVVVGAGPLDAQLRQQMPEVTFLGARHGADLARIYASLDVFVHTGPHETFCQTVQEAQASGVPVVAPAVGGPLDLIRHGHTGLLVPPCDAQALADTVAGLAADGARRRRLGEAGRVAVGSRGWTAVGDELIGHYRRALGRGPTPPRAQVGTDRVKVGAVV